MFCWLGIREHVSSFVSYQWLKKRMGMVIIQIYDRRRAVKVIIRRSQQLNYVASNDRMIDELEWILKETFVACRGTIPAPGGTEENQENLSIAGTSSEIQNDVLPEHKPAASGTPTCWQDVGSWSSSCFINMHGLWILPNCHPVMKTVLIAPRTPVRSLCALNGAPQWYSSVVNSTSLAAPRDGVFCTEYLDWIRKLLSVRHRKRYPSSCSNIAM
jgi:hypothetical protein